MPNNAPAPDERRIEQLELNFPAASGVAFSNAYDRALQAGLSVMVSENGAIFEVFPDGQRRLVKEIAPPRTTQSGVKIRFQ